MTVVVTDPFAAMRDEIERAGQRTDLPAEERLLLLREMRADLDSLVGLVQRYQGDAYLEQEARQPSMQEAILRLRESAVIRERMIESGRFTADELDQFGLLSNDDIDLLHEEKLLEAWVLEEWPHIDFDPVKHPRGPGGKWADILGRVIHPKGRGGKKVPGINKAKRAENAAADAASDAKGGGRETGKAGGAARATKRDAKSTKDAGAAAGGDVKKMLAQVQAAGKNDWPKPGPEGEKILRGAKSTQELHTVPVRGKGATRWYTPERQQLHDRIVDTLLRQRAAVENDRGDVELHPHANGEFIAPPTDAKPRALFMAGGTASGKSTALALPENRAIVPEDQAVHIDPDEIKAMLPEYVQMQRAKDPAAANAVHEESSDIAKRLYDEATKRGLHLVIDGTGDSGEGKFVGKLQAAKDAGYDVHVLYVNSGVDTAIERAVRRAQRTGRWVPEPVIRDQHRDVSARFGEVRQAVEAGHVSGIRMYQTDAQDPVLFAEGGNGAFTIREQQTFQAFVAKAEQS